ncbi:CRISPR-associated endonuclease Cas2 [Rhabdothermincola sp.]|uniref:CRISPR-associated endonuclease Cas2 n=1 Tax=Rhabdothermincola sp. TaxID=2820405 RepID=UPI002FDF760C
MDVVVTYDIRTADPAGQRRLARVAAVCERYGSRVQYSVFECRLDDVLLQKLISELLEEIDRRVDSVNIYRLGLAFENARESIGTRGMSWGDPWIV